MQQPPMQIVAIEGNIGVGKSTLVRELRRDQERGGAEEGGWPADIPVEKEPTETWEGMLSAFYDDPRKNALRLQLEILRSFGQRISDVESRLHAGSYHHPPVNVAVMERCMESCAEVFVPLMATTGVLSEEERRECAMRYGRLARLASPLARLAGIVYLDCSPDACMDRIRKRSFTPASTRDGNGSGEQTQETTTSSNAAEMSGMFGSRASGDFLSLDYVRDLGRTYEAWLSTIGEEIPVDFECEERFFRAQARGNVPVFRVRMDRDATESASLERAKRVLATLVGLIQRGAAFPETRSQPFRDSVTCSTRC